MKTVLIIEDNRDIRENTTEMLELEGYNVIVAADGLTGFTMAKENKPDIILCDILMPEKDGYEVFVELKNDADTVQIPFVFFTASAEKSEVEKGLEMGAKGYIRKPFEAEELFETVERCLCKK